MKKYLFLLLPIVFFACNTTHQLQQKQASTNKHQLRKYSKSVLITDFDLLVNSLKEAHTGLYWYATEQQFDSIVQHQKLELKDSLNGIDFYNIVAPIVAFAKEDHCDISLPAEVKAFLREKTTYLPIAIRYLQQQTYIINNPKEEEETKGWILKELNGVAIEVIFSAIFKTFASDGYIESSKYRWLEDHRFSYLYGLTFGFQDTYQLTIKHPTNGQLKMLEISAVDYLQWRGKTRAFNKEKRAFEDTHPAIFELLDDSTATLTINTFDNGSFKENKMNFEQFVSESFEQINQSQIKNLIIDIRENGGGNEGNEDYLFSYLTDEPYRKYKYVECSAYTYSFLEYTDWSGGFKRQLLKWMLKREHYTTSDGRIIRKKKRQKTEPLKENPFTKNVYILTSGWTYSGPAEFASLMKQHTDAVFIGEEVGGGYYGNTSGWGLELMLPHTKVVVDIPILKFALDVDGVEFGRGVIPDYPIQPTIDEFLNGYDAEMEFAKELIAKKH